MKPPVPHNAALRQLAADLAERPAGEIAGVLRGLAPERRRRVQALLNETRAPAPETTAGLSPWLAERLAVRSGSSVTDRTAQALRRCAATLPGGTAAAMDRPSLLSRLTARRPGRAS